MLKKPNPFKKNSKLSGRAQTSDPNALDLAMHPPRSPFEMLNGYVWLPRAIDKARAHLMDKLGTYTYGKPGTLDAFFFTQHGISAEEFAKAVRAASSDHDVVTWFCMRTKIKSPQAIKDHNLKFVSLAPTSGEALKAFLCNAKAAVPPEHVDQIKTWFQLLDADEGRLDKVLAAR